MTKRDLFRVLIKIFGFYSGIITLFSIVPGYVSTLPNDFIPMLFLFVFGMIFLSLLLVYVLIFKTDFIIDKLKLDQGFDEDRIQFENLNNENLLKFAVLIIGGFLVLDYLPSFLNHTFQAFKTKIHSTENNIYTINYFNWISSGINLVLGYLLLTNFKRIASYFNKL
ncbi:hypothetical protein [Flavobacterium sp.]|jgi:hypothetical protein|uniref:hypothetical protein n=1 Tax=Flavobacterium sp. TaxID=239 RepID=UPI0037BE3BFF